MITVNQKHDIFQKYGDDLSRDNTRKSKIEDSIRNLGVKRRCAKLGRHHLVNVVVCEVILQMERNKLKLSS